MHENNAHDRWESGDPYETYVGRWSRRVAPQFLAWLGAAEHSRSMCGTMPAGWR